MNEQPDDRDDAELERHARDMFQASVDELDAATLSRLNRSRQQALAVAEGRNRSGWRWTVWGSRRRTCSRRAGRGAAAEFAVGDGQARAGRCDCDGC